MSLKCSGGQQTVMEWSDLISMIAGQTNNLVTFAVIRRFFLARLKVMEIKNEYKMALLNWSERNVRCYSKMGLVYNGQHYSRYFTIMKRVYHGRNSERVQNNVRM